MNFDLMRWCFLFQNLDVVSDEASDEEEEEAGGPGVQEIPPRNLPPIDLNPDDLVTHIGLISKHSQEDIVLTLDLQQIVIIL